MGLHREVSVGSGLRPARARTLSRNQLIINILVISTEVSAIISSPDFDTPG
jgi:hypothetical protein